MSNTAPWTYLGRRPVSTNPQAGFDSGLDVFALRSLRHGRHAAARCARCCRRTEPPRGRSVLTLHDLAELTLEVGRPVAFQVDGEYVGEHEVRQVPGRCPDALRVIA